MWNHFSQAVWRIWGYDTVAWISTYELNSQHQAGLRAAGLSYDAACAMQGATVASRILHLSFLAISKRARAQRTEQNKLCDLKFWAKLIQYV